MSDWGVVKNLPSSIRNETEMYLMTSGDLFLSAKVEKSFFGHDTGENTYQWSYDMAYNSIWKQTALAVRKRYFPI